MSIIHRFTPPTCTLEIWDNNSLLSRWTKQEVSKNISFQLSFDDPRVPEEEQITISGDRKKLEQIYNLVLDYTEKFLQQSFSSQLFSPPSISEENIVTSSPLAPANELVDHGLYLEDFTTVNSAQKIQLTALQLFDLVSALEEYKSQVAVAAERESEKKSFLTLPLWTKIAVATIFTVGVVNLLFQLTRQPTIPESAISSEEENRQEPEPLADALEVVPPQIPETEPKPTPQPKTTEPLSSANTLPPPPAVDLPKPPPDIPNPENYPLPEVGKTVAPEIESFQDLQPPPLDNQTNSPAEPQSPQVESNIIVSQEDSESKSLEIPGTNATSPDTNANQQEEIALNPDKTIDQYISDRLAKESLSDSPTKENQQNENNLDLTAKKTDSNIAEIVQTKEIKSYFEQKWQPPAELTRTLEYRLFLNQNGSINRIIPIGRASEIYLDRTNLPLRGETFVSPLKNTDQVTIRLILSPDGDVNTFLE